MVVVVVVVSVRFGPKMSLHNHTHNHLRLYGFCLGQPRWAGTRRNIHPLTPIVVINCPLSTSSIQHDPWHPSCSVHAPDSLFPQSLQVFFGLPLGLAPSTSYSIHFFIQSLSSFCNRCPYHHSLLAAVPRLCHLSLVSLLTLYLEFYVVASCHTSI